MKPPAFKYVAARTVDEAIRHLTRTEKARRFWPEAKALPRCSTSACCIRKSWSISTGLRNSTSALKLMVACGSAP